MKKGRDYHSKSVSSYELLFFLYFQLKPIEGEKQFYVFQDIEKMELGEKNQMDRAAKELQKKKIFENLLKIHHHVGDTLNVLDKIQTEKYLPDYILLTTKYGGETVIFYEEVNIEKKSISVV